MTMENFWNFSVQHYSRPGVADSCLALQDEHNLDVNLVLFCIWYGQNFGELSQLQLDEVISFSISWADNVVKPLRQARRWIKQHNEVLGIPGDSLEEFRSKVKRLELEAEHLQQDRLQQLLALDKPDCLSAGESAVSVNLDSYLIKMGIGKNESVLQHLSIISGEL